MITSSNRIAGDTTTATTKRRPCDRGFHMKVGPLFLEWLDDACAKTERNRASFLAAGAASLAEREGIIRPPARRS